MNSLTRHVVEPFASVIAGPLTPSGELIATVGAVLIASVLGSAHCVGMCGGFVAYCSAGTSCKPNAARSMALSSYHLGRMISYCSIGVLAGWLGSGLNLVGEAAGFRNTAAIALAGLLVIWGVYIVAGRGLDPPLVSIGRTFEGGMLARALQAVARRPQWQRNLVVGLGTIALPCGWLYAFALVAAQTGSMVGGGIVMLVFWIGTLPLMLLFGYVVQHLSLRLRRLLPRVAGAFLVLAGIVSLSVHAFPANGTAHCKHHQESPIRHP